MIQSITEKLDLQPIHNFLAGPTPDSWVEKALKSLDILLIDHAHCEKKAASSALNLIYRYADKPELLDKMSRLAREELRHFEQVLKLMRKHNIEYRHLSPGGYAANFKQKVAT